MRYITRVVITFIFTYVSTGCTIGKIPYKLGFAVSALTAAYFIYLYLWGDKPKGKKAFCIENSGYPAHRCAYPGFSPKYMEEVIVYDIPGYPNHWKVKGYEFGPDGELCAFDKRLFLLRSKKNNRIMKTRPKQKA